jgi:alkylation response protein AidB-like acyl-CoA dehydrogenase
MSAELTEEQGAIPEMALEFAQTKLTPYAREWDEKKSLPAEALPRAAAQGVGVTGSEALDGSGPADRSAAVNAGKIDISVGSIIGLCASIMGVCLERHLPVGLAMAADWRSARLPGCSME